MAPRHHTLDVYAVELHMATNRRDWATLRRRFDFLRQAPDAMGSTQSAQWKPKRPGPEPWHVIIWVDTARHDDRLSLIDTCAHEATHAVDSLMQHIGHTPTGSDEPRAYLAGWLTRWLWDGCEWQAGDER